MCVFNSSAEREHRVACRKESTDSESRRRCEKRQSNRRERTTGKKPERLSCVLADRLCAFVCESAGERVMGTRRPEADKSR